MKWYTAAPAGLRWTAAAVYMLLLTYLLLTPDPWKAAEWAGAGMVGGGNGRIPDWLEHLVGYGVLAATTALAAVPATRRGCLVVWAAVCLHGAATEIAQYFLPPRTADPWDFIADVVGASLGVVLYMLLWFWLFHSRAAAGGGDGSTDANRPINSAGFATDWRSSP
ncbi:MAG: VanZ family protein [Planctomycetia bacterium]